MLFTSGEGEIVWMRGVSGYYDIDSRGRAYCRALVVDIRFDVTP